MRAVRLAALADAPHAFDSTLERERDRSEAEWGWWCSAAATFLFEHQGEALGMAAGVPHRDCPGSVLLIAVWVHPDRRGTGAADRLVAEVIEWARAQGAAEVCLHVERDNPRARRFYAQCGFRETGQAILRQRDGVAEVEMRRALAAPERVQPLTLELLAWLAARPRTRAEAMDAWRSACPRHTAWEDALAEGLLAIQGEAVVLTPRGRELLLRAGGGAGPPRRASTPSAPGS